jgi:hypothetical protein
MRKVAKNMKKGSRVYNSQPRSISEDVKCSRNNFYRTNDTFIVCKKKMLRAIGRATLVVEWNDGESGSVDFGHTGVKINKIIHRKDMKLTCPQGKHRESLQREGG